jgi:hypothetical protein
MSGARIASRTTHSASRLDSITYPLTESPKNFRIVSKSAPEGLAIEINSQ